MGLGSYFGLGAGGRGGAIIISLWRFGGGSARRLSSFKFIALLMQALLDTPPSAAAICLNEMPCAWSALSLAMRSGVQSEAGPLMNTPSLGYCPLALAVQTLSSAASP